MFQPLPPSNDLVEANFIDLNANFGLSREQILRLVTASFSLDEMRDYQRAVQHPHNHIGTNMNPLAHANLVSLFTLFSTWDSIPNHTKLQALDKLANDYPVRVMQAFKSLQEPTQETWKREVYGFLNNGRHFSAIKALREKCGYELWTAKQIIDHIRTGESMVFDLRITTDIYTLASSMREEYMK